MCGGWEQVLFIDKMSREQSWRKKLLYNNQVRTLRKILTVNNATAQRNLGTLA
jgi:hypothetical protein